MTLFQALTTSQFQVMAGYTLKFVSWDSWLKIMVEVRVTDEKATKIETLEIKIVWLFKDSIDNNSHSNRILLAKIIDIIKRHKETGMCLHKSILSILVRIMMGRLLYKEGLLNKEFIELWGRCRIMFKGNRFQSITEKGHTGNHLKANNMWNLFLYKNRLFIVQ